MATFPSSECATTCFFDLQGSDARLSEVFQGLGNPVLQSIRDQYGISGSAAPTQDNAGTAGERCRLVERVRSLGDGGFQSPGLQPDAFRAKKAEVIRIVGQVLDGRLPKIRMD
jgi:hypothetical protein